MIITNIKRGIFAVKMKKIILFFVALIIVIGSSYGFAQWSLAKSHSKVVKSDDQKSSILTEEQVKKGMKEEGYKNEQIYALDHSEITKPEFSSFPVFVDQMRKEFNKDNAAFIAGSYAYAKYFMEKAKDEGMKEDARKIMEQTKKVIINEKNQKDIDDLYNLYVNLDKKYNAS